MVKSCQACFCRSDVKVLKNGSVQQRKLLMYAKLDPKIEYSVEALAPASSSASAPASSSQVF
eukprot:3153374-Amphidinium_carterae.1